MEQKGYLQLLSDYKPRGIRDKGRPCEGWREQFLNLIVIVLNLTTRNWPLKNINHADDENNNMKTFSGI
jgi:hypothetical protein